MISTRFFINKDVGICGILSVVGNYLKLQPFVQTPDSTYFNKGTEAKKRLKQQVTSFAKNLDEIDRQKYVRDLKNNGGSPNRLSETNKSDKKRFRDLIRMG